MRKFDSKGKFWALTFLSWSVLFLFAIVSPYFGIVIGWPNRFPYFVLMPMAMLGGLAISWLEDRLLSSPRRGSLGNIARYSLLTAIVLSVLIHAYGLQQFTYYPYANEIRVSEWLDGNLKPGERAASFGTVSYVFNVVSNGWQVDGGYVQGQINPDFYDKYFKTFMELDDEDFILKTLNETNTRFIIIPQGMKIPSTYADQKYFDHIDMPGFSIFRLKDNYTLDLVTVIKGNASVDYDYSNPDEFLLSVKSSSERITLLVKMNYYPGWVARSSQAEVKLAQSPDGLMEIEASGAQNLDITLQYRQTWIDQMALGTTIAGVVIYLLVLLGGLKGFKRPNLSI